MANTAERIAEMNQLFAAHDAEIRRTPKTNVDRARNLDRQAQAIKTELLTAGVRLGNDQKGMFHEL